MSVASGWVTPLHDLVLGITLGQQRLVADGAGADPGRALVTVAEMDGWFEPAPDATGTFEHWSGDGSVSEMARTGGRVIRASGVISGPDLKSVLEVTDAFAAMSKELFTVDEKSRMLPREADVRVLTFRPRLVMPTRAEYGLTLLADDPLRYSSASVGLVNGSNVLVNRGDRDAWPTLEFVGPHAAVSLTHPGGVYTLSALAAGVARTVDLRNGDVWQGGVRVFGVESGPVPVVPAGGTSWTFAGLGTGSARVRRFEAWS